MKNKSGRNIGAVTACSIFCVFFSLAGSPGIALDRKEYRILIAFDTVLPFSEGIIDGFRTTMDAQLALAGAKAVYQVFDTKLDPGTIPAIMDAITGTNYRIVSSNPIPVKSGVIPDWQKPGGNVTGVGVFLKFNPQIKLMKLINPKPHQRLIPGIYRL